MTQAQTTRGGRRPGAGAKRSDPSGERLVVLTVRVTPAQQAAYRATPGRADKLRAWLDSLASQ
jgi:hypothetical protein